MFRLTIMKTPCPYLIESWSNLAFLTAIGVGFMLVPLSLNAQSVATSKRNNPYSPSPPGSAASRVQRVETSRPFVDVVAAKEVSGSPGASLRTTPATGGNSIAGSVLIEPSVAPSTAPLTDIYLIGSGDVLFINLKNSPQGTGRYVVRPDGTIDYPLAGPGVMVRGQTVDGVSARLRTAIKLYAVPQIDVKVLEFASHKVAVLGLVDGPGEKYIRREAIPLFVIKAEAGVSRSSTRVKVTRSGSGKIEVFELRQPDADNALVYAGDTVEFIEK